MNNTRAYSQLEVKSFDEEERVIKGWATTPQPDRVQDVVDPMGATFKNPMPLLWQHKHDEPVGLVKFGKPTPEGIPFEAKLPKIVEEGNLKERVDEAWQSVKAQLVRHVSIGFRVLKDGAEMLASGGMKFTKTEIFELSLVTIPAQPNATITEIKAYDKGLLSAASGNPEQEPEAQTTSPRRDQAKTTIVKLAPAKGKDMRLQESLKSYEGALAAKKAERLSTVQKSLDEGRTADAAELETIQTLNAEIKALDDQITMVKGLIESDVASAKPIDGSTEQKGIASRKAEPLFVSSVKHAGEGLAMAQFLRLKHQSQGNPFYAAQLAESQKGSLDPRVVDMTKAAVPAANTQNPTWAGNLVTQGGVVGDFVAYLRKRTVLGAFGTGNIPSLRNVEFNVPLLGQTSGGAAAWTREGAAKMVTKFDFNQNILQPLKVATIAVLTEELLRRSSIQADTMIRDQLVAALTERLDIDFLDPAKAAVAGVSPASITNGVAGIVSSGNDAAAIRNDITKLMQAFIAANNVPSTGVFIMGTTLALQLSLMQNPLGQSEFPGIGMSGGIFLGMPVIVSDYAPAETVILVNASDVYLGDEGGLQVDFSREASLEMDTAPTHNGTTPTGSTSLVSLWQANLIGVRCERFLNWAKRRPEAVQVLTTVKWGQPTTP